METNAEAYVKSCREEVQRKEAECDRIDQDIKALEQQLEVAKEKEADRRREYWRQQQSTARKEENKNKGPPNARSAVDEPGRDSCSASDAAQHGGAKKNGRARRKQRGAERRQLAKESEAVPDPLFALSTSLKVVGVAHTPFNKRFEAPRQPFHSSSLGAHITFSEESFSDELADAIESAKKMWIVYWFDRNEGWRELVYPPRSTDGRKGLFATRTPNRPNPIGLSLSNVVKVDRSSRSIYVDEIDLLNGTPIFGVRPYDFSRESKPSASIGWVEKAQTLYYDDEQGGNEDSASSKRWELESLTDEVVKKLRFVDQNSNVDVMSIVERTLQKNPFQSYGASKKTRNKKYNDLYSLPIGTWRILYDVVDGSGSGDSNGGRVRVTDVASALPPEDLEKESDVDPEVVLHRKFLELFNEGKSAIT